MPLTRRTLKLTVLAALVMLAIIEGTSLLGLTIASRVLAMPISRRSVILRDQSTQIAQMLADPGQKREVVDSVLGWRYRAGYVRGNDRISAQGLRSIREYTPVPLAGVIRVAAFGDSFVYGNEVDTQDAWTSQAERLMPNLEILNHGVGGYGNDQAYLRFVNEGTRHAPSVVLLGFTPDDLRRLVSVYRRFIDEREFPFTKPRFALDSGGALVLRPSPIRDTAGLARLMRKPILAREFGEHDQWYPSSVYSTALHDISPTVRLVSALWTRVHRSRLDPDRLLIGGQFNPASTAFALQVAIAERFAADARQRGVLPLFVILPDRHAIEVARGGQPPVFAPLLDSLRARGVEFIDTTPAFVSAKTDDVGAWFMAGGHYSPSGNEVVARAVGQAIVARVRSAGDSVRVGGASGVRSRAAGRSAVSVAARGRER
jgi:hypothetical protein